jgi:hypothetical protein
LWLLNEGLSERCLSLARYSAAALFNDPQYGEVRSEQKMINLRQRTVVGCTVTVSTVLIPPVWWEGGEDESPHVHARLKIVLCMLPLAFPSGHSLSQRLIILPLTLPVQANITIVNPM